jgi:hypothetical protein
VLYLLLDTSAYILIARGNFPEIIDEINERIITGEIVLFTNEIIQEEWTRHKNDTINAIIKRIKSETNSAKRLSYFLTERIKEAFNNAIAEYESDEKYLLDMANYLIKKVDDLIFNKSKVTEITDSLKLKIIELAIDKKAPFHHKSNSVGDALILFSYIEFLEKDSERSSAYFLTINPDDFSLSAKEAEKNVIHPDLAPYLEKVQLKYTTEMKNVFTLADEISKDFDEYVAQSLDDWIIFENDVRRGK